MASGRSQLEKLLKENADFANEARNRIDPFLKEKFTIQNFLQLQKRSFAIDLLINPLNALWLIPYLTIKKFVEVVDKLGFEKFDGVAQKIPPTIKTSFQLKLDSLIADELFNKDQANVRNEVKSFGNKQAGISDLTSSGVTFFIAHLFLGNSSLNIFEVAQNIARLWEKDEAASKFILGKELGRAFYGIAPAPEASAMKIMLAALVLLAFVSLVTTLVAFIFPLIQYKIGFQKHNLLKLISGIEDKTALQIMSKAS